MDGTLTDADIARWYRIVIDQVVPGQQQFIGCGPVPRWMRRKSESY
jgi:hypothetical protein